MFCEDDDAFVSGHALLSASAMLDGPQYSVFHAMNIELGGYYFLSTVREESTPSLGECIHFVNCLFNQIPIINPMTRFFQRPYLYRV